MAPKPGTHRPKKETAKEFRARMAKQMRKDAIAHRQAAERLENSASVLDGKFKP